MILMKMTLMMIEISHAFQYTQIGNIYLFIYTYILICSCLHCCMTYIAPTVDTINTFWQMITGYKPLLVVMVTKFIENGKVQMCIIIWYYALCTAYIYIYFDLKCIIFITFPVYHSQSKCEEYFPLKVGEQKLFGPFRITTVSMTYQVEYEIRTIKIILVSGYILCYIRILYLYAYILYIYSIILF